MKAQERKELFKKMLELYYLDQRNLSHISRTLGVSEAACHNWFNLWARGELYTDIKKPKLETSDILRIAKSRYL
jgi:transposase-like protein